MTTRLRRSLFSVLCAGVLAGVSLQAAGELSGVRMVKRAVAAVSTEPSACVAGAAVEHRNMIAGDTVLIVLPGSVMDRTIAFLVRHGMATRATPDKLVIGISPFGDLARIDLVTRGVSCQSFVGRGRFVRRLLEAIDAPLRPSGRHAELNRPQRPAARPWRPFRLLE